MKLIKGLTVIFGGLLVGYILENFIPFLIPGTIYGMFVVFLLFIIGIIKPRDLEQVSKPLLSHLPLFFIPPAVGVIEIFPLIKDHLHILLFIILVSTILTLSVTALVVKKVIENGSR